MEDEASLGHVMYVASKVCIHSTSLRSKIGRWLSIYGAVRACVLFELNTVKVHIQGKLVT